MHINIEHQHQSDSDINKIISSISTTYEKIYKKKINSLLYAGLKRKSDHDELLLKYVKEAIEFSIRKIRTFAGNNLSQELKLKREIFNSYEYVFQLRNTRVLFQEFLDKLK
jgi:hypothetical protein